MTTADTQAIMARHWQALTRGDVPALLADYADDAVLISGATGVIKGRPAIGDILTFFVSTIIPAASTAFSLDLTYAEGTLGYIVWKAESATHRIAFSSDTFFVTAGLITMQTSAGSVDSK
ncbi:MAG: nuclear transport factor 2 family protein [Pseudomonadota bacterium]|nr:nuclear transport factor 2 family protein [Pseudomonadota bacterium]